MTNDPELKAMSDVFDALQSLDVNTQKRVVDWVLAKLQTKDISSSTGAKRGRKPGSKRAKRGRKPSSSSSVKAPGAKRGPKPGSKRSVKLGKRGRPPGSLKKSDGKTASKSQGLRGRPRKNDTSN